MRSNNIRELQSRPKNTKQKKGPILWTNPKPKNPIDNAFRRAAGVEIQVKSSANRPLGFNRLLQKLFMTYQFARCNCFTWEHSSQTQSWKHARQLQYGMFLEILTRFWCLDRVIKMGPQILELYWFRKSTVTWPEAILLRASSSASSDPNQKFFGDTDFIAMLQQSNQVETLNTLILTSKRKRSRSRDHSSKVDERSEWP